jgi:hypothetical protein
MGPATPTAPPRTQGGEHEHALPTRWQRLRPSVVLAGAVLVASLALHVRDPHQQGSWGFCPWLLLTGTLCPGCGGLRAVNDLTHGEVLSAASSNLLLVGALPLAAGLWVRSVSQRWRGVRSQWSPARVNLAWAVAVVAMVAFWVLRNLPWDAASWLAP